MHHPLRFIVVLAAGCGNVVPNLFDASVAQPDAAPTVTPRILDVSPTVANTGDTVTLEGDFADGLMVRFPGSSALVAATVDGAHRAHVVVPADATAGDLSVVVGTLESSPVTFRRASFALGLQDFQAEYEQTNGGRQAPVLAQAGANFGWAVARDTVYVVGGGSPSGPLDTVQAARINADGTLAPFAVVAHMTTARYQPSVKVIGDYLYVISGGTTTIERATLHPDGTLDPFALVTATLPSARAAFAAEVVGNRLYVLGGNGTSAALTEVASAPIADDGSLGAFTVEPHPLLTPRYSHGSAVLGNWLYVMGGQTAPNNVQVDTIERAPIHGDGTIGDFAIAPGTALTRGEASFARLGSKLYALGGYGNQTVQVAAIAADGTLGSFATLSNVTGVAPQRKSCAVAVAGNYLYLLGGADGSYLASTEHAQIGTPAAPGSLATMSDVHLVKGRWSYVSLVARNHYYALGGFGTSGAIERADVAPDGTLGTFATAGSLVSERGGAAGAVVGNYIYLFSGSDGANTLTTVERAAINEDGTLGSFAIVPGLTVSQRFQGRAIVLGNYVYLLSGDQSFSAPPIERAAIASDGSLGAFSTVSGVNLTQYEKSPGFAVVRGAVITAGGAHGTYDDLVQRATYDANGNLATFSNVGTLPQTLASPTSFVIGGGIWLVGGGNSSGDGTQVLHATINSDGTIGAFTATSQRLDAARSCELGCGAWLGNHLWVPGGSTDSTTVVHTTVQ